MTLCIFRNLTLIWGSLIKCGVENLFVGLSVILTTLIYRTFLPTLHNVPQVSLFFGCLYYVPKASIYTLLLKKAFHFALC